MSRPLPGDTGHLGHNERSTLVARLAEVRTELDRLVGARMREPFTAEQHHRYQELGEQERGLLQALAPDIPERRPLP